MQPDDRSTTPAAAKTAVDRLIFFSDAVVAIAMTLLAIDLPVPSAETATEWLHQVNEYLPEYFALLISFLVIARYWRTHHMLFRYITDTTNRLVVVNLSWLFAVILTPYATRIIFAGDSTSDSDFPWRFGSYAVVQAFAGLSMYACARVIASADLLVDTAPPRLLQRNRIANLAVASTFLVSIPMSVLIGAWAFVVWIALGFVTDAAIAVHHRRHPEATQ